VALKPTPFPGQVIAVFNYRFVSRNLGAIWAVGWVGAGTIFTIYSLFFVSEGNKLALLGLWGILLLLTAVALFSWNHTRKTYQPVTVTDAGIANDLRREKFEVWPKRKPGFIGFDEITEIAMVAKPDMDADETHFGVSAMRIRAREKKMVIMKKIEGFDHLCALIESEMRRRGKPLRISPKDVEIPAGTGTTVVYP
jgi:hypothetical protein